MSSLLFDIALEKRFTDSPESVVMDITAADLLLIRNNETGVMMRLPFSVLAEAVSGALTGYLKSSNNLSDVANAGTARTNLGATTLGSNLFTLPNQGAVRFPRFNADNTVSALDAASFRAAIGAGTSSATGTVTSVGLSAPTGFTVSGSPVTGSGTLSFSFSAGYSLPSNTAQAAWDAKEPTITAGTTTQYWRGDKSWQTLNKSAVGLGNVDNTSDANKPVSTAQQTALNAKEPGITAGGTSQYWRGDKSWQTLNQTAVTGLKTTDKPQFRGITSYSGQNGNVGPGNSDIPTVSDTGGICVITARQGGVGTSTRIVSYNNRGGTLNLTLLGTTIVTADPLSGVSVSGANIRCAVPYANTNIQYGFIETPT